MKFGWIIVALAVFALLAADDAEARARKAKRQCVDGPKPFSWNFLLPGGGYEPRPNGCAPAVYEYGRYIGQDPDPNIRLQLKRDPRTGYSQEMY